MNSKLWVLVALLFTVNAFADDTRYVIASSVNLREQPNVDAKIVAKVPIATRVTVLPTNDLAAVPLTVKKAGEEVEFVEWVEVTTLDGSQKGQRGWVVSEYLVDEQPTLEWLLKKFDATAADDVENRRKWAERVVALDSSSPDVLARVSAYLSSEKSRGTWDLSAEIKRVAISSVRIQWTKAIQFREGYTDQGSRNVPRQVAVVGDGVLVGWGPDHPHMGMDSVIKVDRNGAVQWQKQYEHKSIHAFVPYKNGFLAYGQCYAICIGVRTGSVGGDKIPWIMVADESGDPLTHYFFEWALFSYHPLLVKDGESIDVFAKVELCDRQVCYEKQTNPSSYKFRAVLTRTTANVDSVKDYFILPRAPTSGDYQFHSVDTFELVPTTKGFVHVGAYVLFGHDGAYRSEVSHFVATSNRDGKLRWIRHLGGLNKAVEVKGNLFLIGASTGVRVVRLSEQGETIHDKTFSSGNRLIQITDTVRYADGFLVSGTRFDRKCEGLDYCSARQNEQDFLMRFDPDGALVWEQEFPRHARVVNKILVVDDGVMLFSDSAARITKISAK